MLAPVWRVLPALRLQCGCHLVAPSWPAPFLLLHCERRLPCIPPSAMLPALSEEIKGYLGTRFTLRDGDRPHLMTF